MEAAEQPQTAPLGRVDPPHPVIPLEPEIAASSREAKVRPATTDPSRAGESFAVPPPVATSVGEEGTRLTEPGPGSAHQVQDALSQVMPRPPEPEVPPGGSARADEGELAPSLGRPAPGVAPIEVHIGTIEVRAESKPSQRQREEPRGFSDYLAQRTGDWEGG